MKHFLRLFALMAVFLMSNMGSADAATKLKYDFVTKHPSSNLRIDQGYKEVRGSYAYWTGAWAGLFGNKIAFATDSYPVLRSSGGLVDYHSSRKTYLMNLSVGDQVVIYYKGTDPSVQFHTSGSARLTGVTTQYQKLESGTYYTVSTAGNLAMLNRWVQGSNETIIDSIIIVSVKDYETVDVSNGLSTFCSTVPLDFSSLTSTKAFITSGYSDGKFTFKQVNYVPSNTGFLVVRDGGSANSVNIPVGRSSNYKDNVITGNMFIGCLEEESIPVNDDDEYKYYCFGKAYGYIGCYLMWWNFTCAANKAYIAVKK